MGTNETFMSCRVGDLILRETTTSTTALVQELTAVCVVWMGKQPIFKHYWQKHNKWSPFPKNHNGQNYNSTM